MLWWWKNVTNVSSKVHNLRLCIDTGERSTWFLSKNAQIVVTPISIQIEWKLISIVSTGERKEDPMKSVAGSPVHMLEQQTVQSYRSIHNFSANNANCPLSEVNLLNLTMIKFTKVWFSAVPTVTNMKMQRRVIWRDMSFPNILQKIPKFRKGKIERWDFAKKKGAHTKTQLATWSDTLKQNTRAS